MDEEFTCKAKFWQSKISVKIYDSNTHSVNKKNKSSSQKISNQFPSKMSSSLHQNPQIPQQKFFHPTFSISSILGSSPGRKSQNSNHSESKKSYVHELLTKLQNQQQIKEIQRSRNPSKESVGKLQSTFDLNRTKDYSFPVNFWEGVSYIFS